MNLAELERSLIAAARTNPPDERVPYAFEKRIMARIKESGRGDEWALWARALGRGALTCAGLMLLLVAWSFILNVETPATTDLSQEFDNTILAAVEPDSSPDSLW